MNVLQHRCGLDVMNVIHSTCPSKSLGRDGWCFANNCLNMERSRLQQKQEKFSLFLRSFDYVLIVLAGFYDDDPTNIEKSFDPPACYLVFVFFSFGIFCLSISVALPNNQFKLLNAENMPNNWMEIHISGQWRVYGIEIWKVGCPGYISDVHLQKCMFKI